MPDDMHQKASERIRERNRGVPEVVVDDGSPPRGQVEPTVRTRLGAVEETVALVERRTHPGRQLAGAIVAVVLAIVGAITAIESLATHSYVDAQIAPLVRDHDVLMRMDGYVRGLADHFKVEPSPPPTQTPPQQPPIMSSASRAP
jgi:hypothetical protein